MTSQSVDLDFDPSMEEHHYSIHFSVMPLDAKEVHLFVTKGCKIAPLSVAINNNFLPF